MLAASYDASETPSTVIGVAFFVVWFVTLFYPWRFKTRTQRVFMHLPIVLLPLYGLYEFMMPSRMNIRLDIPLFLVALVAAAVCYLTKLVVASTQKSVSKD
jgi:hypothetical protein